MLLKQLVLEANKSNKNSDKYTRYIVKYHDGLQRPVVIQLKSTNYDISIKIFDTNIPYLVKKTSLKDDKLIKSLIESSLQDNQVWVSVKDTPLTVLDSCVISGTPVIQRIVTNEKYVRKGLGTLALRVAQDYYAKRPENFNYLYVSRKTPSEDIIYENKLESKLGKFGDMLAYVKSKIMTDRKDDAFIKNFLGAKNHFSIESSPYSMPKKRLRRRGLIDSMLVDEEKKQSAIQVYDDVLSTQQINEDYFPPRKDVEDFLK